MITTNDYNLSLSLFGGTGFILSTYKRMYPNECIVESRGEVVPTCRDVLYGISTVSNYNVLKSETLKLDVQTNLLHLLDVLPNVKGRFTWLGTWFQYGFNDWGHHPAWRAKESHLCNPTGLYSASKTCAEQYIKSYCATVKAGLVEGPSSYQILRLSNVIGNDPRAGKQKNALEWLLSKVIANEDVPIYEGDNYRDFLHVHDACRAINLVVETGLDNEVYNIGRGESHKMEDLIQYAIDKVGSSSKIVRVPVPSFHQVVQVPNFFMDTGKLRALGFEPKYSIWESVDKVLEGIIAKPIIDLYSKWIKDAQS